MSRIEELEARVTALEGIIDILATHIDGQIDDIREELAKKINLQAQIKEAREIIKGVDAVEKKLRNFLKKA